MSKCSYPSGHPGEYASRESRSTISKRKFTSVTAGETMNSNIVPNKGHLGILKGYYTTSKFDLGSIVQGIWRFLEEKTLNLTLLLHSCRE